MLKKNKIKSYKVDSVIKLNSATYKTDQSILKVYIPNFKGSVDFKDHKIKLSIQKNIFSVQGEGNYSIGELSEQINYEIKKEQKFINFKTKININEALIDMKFLNYQKKVNEASTLIVDGAIKEKNFLVR